MAFAREKGTKRGTHSWGDRRNAVASSLGSAATPSRRTRRYTLCSPLLRLFGVSNLVLALRVALSSFTLQPSAVRHLSPSLLSHVLSPRLVLEQSEVNLVRLVNKEKKEEATDARPPLDVRLANKTLDVNKVSVRFSLAYETFRGQSRRWRSF